MDNEVMSVSDKVINRISKNEYGEIGVEISQESASQLISGLCVVAGQVTGQTFNTVAQIYADALKRQENLEIKSMDDEAEIMRRFNDNVDKAMAGLDLSDTNKVLNFELVCRTLRENLMSEFKCKNNPPSLLSKLFRRR